MPICKIFVFLFIFKIHPVFLTVLKNWFCELSCLPKKFANTYSWLSFRKQNQSSFINVHFLQDSNSIDDPTSISNNAAVMSNVGLMLASILECICAAMASYRCARMVCPCFKRENDTKYDIPTMNIKHALVNSWLTKQSPPPLYVVASPPSIGKHSKVSENCEVRLGCPHSCGIACF